jgi:type I restriction enzyme S subunit
MPFFVATDGIRIISSIEIMDSNYLFYLLEKYKPMSEGYKRHYSILINCACCTSVSMDEQAKIGSVLCRLDHLITLQQRKIEELKRQKKALMQLLLTGIVRVDV